MAIEVVKGGLSTTVQDHGRTGTYDVGMPPAGAMDAFAYRVANRLVGNDPDAAVLEATYLGPELRMTQDAVIAVTGADMPLRINGEEVDRWTTHAVRADDLLSFGFIRSGARAYVAIAGGIDVPPVLGSRSTYTLTGMGGFEGRALQPDDRLAVGAGGRAGVAVGRSVPEALRPIYPREVELRVVVGLSSYRLSDDTLHDFLDTTWTVTSDANRVGYRYRGKPIEFLPRKQPAGAGSDPSNVVDIGYPVGSIQVPGGTEPIALLHDAVTGGGYATVATIISSDLGRAGQSKTNDTTRFVAVTLEDALQARDDERRRLQDVLDDLDGAR